MTSDGKIRDSWRKNASPWIKAIKDEQIESRRLVTNQAIVDRLCTLLQCDILHRASLFCIFAKATKSFLFAR